eukprot:6213856-Pleurochrysis_carterae.AAC.1
MPESRRSTTPSTARSREGRPPGCAPGSYPTPRHAAISSSRPSSRQAKAHANARTASSGDFALSKGEARGDPRAACTRMTPACASGARAESTRGLCAARERAASGAAVGTGAPRASRHARTAVPAPATPASWWR